jgi:GT2 family glycosyltransferase
MNLSVLMPVHNGESFLERSLSALLASSRTPDEIIVVDDGSTDGTRALARRFGVRLIMLSGGPHGPAVARNRAAAAASGDLLVFIDADVVVHHTTLERFAAYFDESPEIAAVFGSYDDKPFDQGMVSRYKNLFHHFVHQQGRRGASTFWAGCGAIRQSVFRQCGGFDESFQRASIEDIELGARLNSAGHRIRSCPDMQATHLKRWTFVGLIYTDVFLRAIPWAQLILRNRAMSNDLNTSRSSRLSAVAAWSIMLMMLIAPWFPWALIGLLPPIVILFTLNARLHQFFYRCGGIRLAAAGACLHFLYYLYSSLAFGLVGLHHVINKRGFTAWNVRNQRSTSATPVTTSSSRSPTNTRRALRLSRRSRISTMRPACK